MYIKDEEARHQYISDHIDFPEVVIGKRDIDIGFTEPESGQRAYEDDMRVIENDETILDQEEHYPAVGEWDLTSKVPIYDADGETIGLLGATRRITERKRAKAELERKTERLERFVDIVSHDIRNPLSVARGYTELIEEPDAEAKYIEQVEQSIHRATAILDDVLALSRQGSAELDQVDAILDDVLTLARHDPNIDAEWASLQRLCHGDAHSITAPRAAIDFPADREVLADRTQLRRLLEDLFTNAVRHGGSDVRIDVELLDDGFAVEDDGPGIPPEEREHVFEESYTTHPDGTGFGLPIVVEIVDAHGWRVSLTSAETGGARFEITGVEQRDRDQ